MKGTNVQLEIICGTSTQKKKWYLHSEERHLDNCAKSDAGHILILERARIHILNILLLLLLVHILNLYYILNIQPEFPAYISINFMSGLAKSKK